MPGPHRAVEIPYLATILRIRKPTRLNGRVPAEQAPLVSRQAQPVLVVRAGTQAGIAGVRLTLVKGSGMAGAPVCGAGAMFPYAAPVDWTIAALR